MSKLLALSFDAPASPRISLRDAATPATPGDTSSDPYGWGIAWYPPDERGAVVVKDPSSKGDDSMSRLLRDWSRFRSTVFVCHLRGASRRRAQQDTHPFSRSHAGRDWLLTQNGDLNPGWRDALPLGQSPAWEPLGRTDSEHILCWLLEKLRAQGIRGLAELGWPTLHAWLGEVNALGGCNLVVSDGTDLVAYQDQGGFNPLKWVRRKPPYTDFVLANDEIELDLSDARDRSRSVVIVATSEVGSDAWNSFSPGQMLVLRRGAVLWDSSLAYEAPEPGGLQQVQLQQAGTSAEPPFKAGSAISREGRAAKRDIAGSRLLRVTHRSLYGYEEPVERSFHLLRLRPEHDWMQEVLEHSLEITPAGESQTYVDVFGNHVVRLEIEQPYRELAFSTTSLVRCFPEHSRQLHATARRASIPLVWMPWQRQMMTPYLLPHELPETQLRELFDYAMSFVERQDYDLVETLVDMNQTIYRDFAYIQGATTVETTPFEVYATRRGVCQDFANLLICMARLLGVPARYRVGYIHTSADYENTAQSDASHAWTELYLPWFGWHGFDPTNGCVANLDHVRVACGRNYRDATPTSGTIFRGGGAEELSVDVRVEIVEEPAE